MCVCARQLVSIFLGIVLVVRHITHRVWMFWRLNHPLQFSVFGWGLCWGSALLFCRVDQRITPDLDEKQIMIENQETTSYALISCNNVRSKLMRENGFSTSNNTENAGKKVQCILAYSFKGPFFELQGLIWVILELMSAKGFPRNVLQFENGLPSRNWFCLPLQQMSRNVHKCP